jgi:hypothetical protein
MTLIERAEQIHDIQFRHPVGQDRCDEIDQASAIAFAAVRRETIEAYGYQSAIQCNRRRYLNSKTQRICGP